MDVPDNCQCYCYTIMNSLCFPCQVKIHLLHLTASPHGELVKNVKCPTPKDRSQSPQPAGKDQSQTPATENCTKTECENCDYYKNFINKLTSGLCEEKILSIVCSNPCLVSSSPPVMPEDAQARKSSTKPSLDEYSNAMTGVSNNATNHKMPSETSLRNNGSIRPKAKDQPTLPNLVPIVSSLAKKKSEIRNDKKPSTPTNLMTTDKILKRSFDSIAKNRPTPIPSRTPSPEKKRPEIKRPPVTDPNPAKTVVPKNDSKPFKNDHKSSALQKSGPNPTGNKGPKNEPNVRQAAKDTGKKIPSSEVKGSTILGKIKPKNESVKSRTPQVKSPVPVKKLLKPPDPGNETENKCNEEVCEFVPGKRHNTGEGNQVQNASKEQKTAERASGSMNQTNDSAHTGGFFEAALVMEFYQPPQLGTRNVGSKRASKPLQVEYEKEPSSPDLGESVVRQFCQKSRRNNTKDSPGVNENITAQNNKQQAFYGQTFAEKQQTIEQTSPPTHYTVVEEYVGRLPPEPEDKTRKHKKQAKPKLSQENKKMELGGEKARRNVRPTTELKKLDDTSRGRKSQSPIFGKVVNNQIDYNGFDESALDNEPVRDSSAKEASYFAKARQREESAQNPYGAGRDGKNEHKETNLTTGTKEVNRWGKDSDNRRNTTPNDEHDTPEDFRPNKTRDLSPAKMFRESVRQSMNNERGEFETATTFMADRPFDANQSKGTGGDIPCWEDDARQYAPETPHELDYIPSTSQGIQEEPINSWKAHQNSDDTGKNRNQFDNCEDHEQVGKKGRLSMDGDDRPVTQGVIRKIRDGIENEYKRSSIEKRVNYDAEYSRVVRKGAEESPKFVGDGSSHSEGPCRPGSPFQKKSRSSSQRHNDGTSDDTTRVYPQFSEYMNPDCEGYRSKSVGNVVETSSAVDIPPVKSKSERGSSKWNCGVCPDDKRVYYHTDSDGKCTSMVIGLQEGRNSNPHIRINFNKQVKQEIACYKVDKSEQKYDYRDAGTQCDSDQPGRVSPEGSRPATAKSSRNRVPDKTSAKSLQASGPTSSAKPTQTIGHQQMFYNRPLMRRSFQ